MVGSEIGASRQAGTQLALIAAVQVLAMTCWFAATAAAPAISVVWDLSGLQAALLTSSVQIGFVTGALGSAFTSLADRVPAPRLVGIGALVAALSTVGVAALGSGGVGGGFASALVLRFATGAGLALVYPLGMKLAVSWFAGARGLAVAVVVGALTLGSTLPHLFAGTLHETWRTVMVVAAVAAVLAFALHPFLRTGPLVDPASRIRPAAAWSLASRRRPRLATLGYLGHMWELYALWAWFPVFFVASCAAYGVSVDPAAVGVVSFMTLGVCGALGCVLAGWAADRVGRARVAAVAMVVSGACCLAAALAFGGPPELMIVVAAVWGAAVIADSAQFSACLGSVVPRDEVGTALTVQTALGFLLTVVTIQAVPVIAETAAWPVAVAVLAVGPFLGAVAMLRLDRLFVTSRPT
ncbi:MFS transporter [Aeromicrobium sp. CTD01-1L150]|uniref:MFS transporter n=1 Tax=Aeromicrobium sp. CTD01-1L150 TaxID=3341830 RepID=UPI0035BF4389